MNMSTGFRAAREPNGWKPAAGTADARETAGASRVRPLRQEGDIHVRAPGILEQELHSTLIDSRPTPRVTCGPSRRAACAVCKRRDGADRQVHAVVSRHSQYTVYQGFHQGTLRRRRTLLLRGEGTSGANWGRSSHIRRRAIDQERVGMPRLNEGNPPEVGLMCAALPAQESDAW